MSIYSTRPITLTNLQTYPLSSRKSKVSVRDFGKPPASTVLGFTPLGGQNDF
jgi:hypothetical protein